MNSIDEILRLFKNMTDGVLKMHKLNSIHRDIKPANFLLHRTDEGRLIAKLADLGISRAIPNA